MNILSLGMGVQSSTLALMASAGLIDPTPDCGIFSDTKHEPGAVYDWGERLTGLLSFPVYTVGRGSLYDESTRVRISGKTGEAYLGHAVPAFVLNVDGTKGTMFRQCTDKHKLTPIRKKALELADGQPIVMWIGISTDEAARMKDSRDKRITHRWPLIEVGMSRNDCLAWLKDHGHPEPPRSACTFCPYHSDAEWLRLKTNDHAGFAEAVRYESSLQAAFKQVPRLTGTPFLHASRKPLTEVDFSKPTTEQVELFNNECEGICGV